MLTVGDFLKKAREEKEITLSQVEKDLRVRAKYLNYLEHNQWEFFSSKVYLEGIIKNYARYLQLDQKKILAYFNRDYEKREILNFKQKKDYQLSSQNKKIIVTTVALIFSFFFLYFIYQIKLYLSPPKVDFLSPTKTHFKKESMIKIKGKVDRESQILISNQKVYPDDKGFFQFDYPLKIGKNQVIIEVTGANGKKTILKKEFIREK